MPHPLARSLSALLCFAFLAPAAEAPKEWTPALHMKVVSVGSVLPSPEGQHVIWSQNEAVMEGDKSEFRSQLHFGKADGSLAVQLTRGEKSASAVGWSPDGMYVYFTSERDGKPALYRISTRGGEAEKVYAFDGSASNWMLSPDGRWLAFTGRAKDETKDKAKKAKADWAVVDDAPENNSLWVVSSDPEKTRQSVARNLLTEGYHVRGFHWSPDGRFVAYSHGPRPDADTARYSDISEVEVESGKVTVVASEAVSESDPLYSPDGRYLAFVRSLALARIEGERILLFDRTKPAADATRLRELPRTHDDTPSLVDWTADSRAILYEETKGTRRGLFRMPIDGPPQPALVPDKGTAAGMATNRARSHVGFTRQSANEPPEAYVADLQSGKQTQVSKANAHLAMPPLGETRVLTWKAKDGRIIEGLLTLPVGYQKGTRYPLILNIHGGPAGVFAESFTGAAGLYPIASFAAKGYAVLRSNIRGSAGYGADFRKMVVKDWGGADFQDLMAGVDFVIAEGIADAEKMAVMGWSYGGFMTFWTVTQTNRFKAAAAGAGITNNLSMWGTQDIPSLFEDYFGGVPYQEMQVYLDRSPMYHVAKATTPLLILHGQQDPRVPPGQGYEFYNAMKRRKVASKMVVYPRTPHGPREPKLTLDVMNQHLAWVEKHLMNREWTPAPAEDNSSAANDKSTGGQ
ncbi:MAG: S9 family peptidase [Bryobacterales bacterium]|nr:S9 family peptidase [Bryobacterales bacterium]